MRERNGVKVLCLLSGECKCKDSRKWHVMSIVSASLICMDILRCCGFSGIRYDIFTFERSYRNEKLTYCS